jgi:hypothetical protein
MSPRGWPTASPHSSQIDRAVDGVVGENVPNHTLDEHAREVSKAGIAPQPKAEGLPRGQAIGGNLMGGVECADLLTAFIP